MTSSAARLHHVKKHSDRLSAGPYIACAVEDARMLGACLALRRDVFRKGQAEDRDRFDDLARHVLLTDRRDGRAVACFRYRILSPGDLSNGYTAQFYDLAALARQTGPMADLGRMAVAPGQGNPDLLRLLLAALTQVALREKLQMIFGCSSFPGADVARHAPALAWLRGHCPLPFGVTARQAVVCPDAPADSRLVSPLLRSYLALGARVAGDPVVDRALDTVHVFTALDPLHVPATRRRSLIRWMRAAGQGAS